MIWVTIILFYLVMLLFAFALCKVAGDADRRSEEEYTKRQKGNLTVKDWITYSEVEYNGYIRSRIVFKGWFDGDKQALLWNDYINKFDDNAKPYLEAIKKEVVINKYRFGGNIHQQKMIPLFSDYTVGIFSYRDWGRLMATIWSEEENKDYDYTYFYMTFE